MTMKMRKGRVFQLFLLNLLVIITLCVHDSRASYYESVADIFLFTMDNTGGESLFVPYYCYFKGYHSYHDNNKEDRHWWLYRGCIETNQGETRNSYGSCIGFTQLNSYDNVLDYNWPSGHVLNGMHSYHNNNKEDRIFYSYTCPSLYEFKLHNSCTDTGFVNDYDNPIDYRCPNSGELSSVGYIRGLYSVHNNHYEDRRWAFRCCNLKPKRCSGPPTVTNGGWSCSFNDGVGYTNNAYCSMTCSSGYEVSTGSAGISCYDESWSSTSAVCNPRNCGNPSNPTNGYYTCSSGTTYTKTCSMSCNSGYQISGSATTVTCTASATWSGYGATCPPRDCGAPANPSNGVFSCPSGTTYPQSCTMSCNAGYQISGSGTTTNCQTSATWSTYTATCQPKNCGTPTNPTNGAYSCPSGTLYPNSCTMSCNAGYDMSGATSVSCTTGGTWSAYGTCVPKNCGTPTNPANGLYTCSSGTSFPNTCTMSCNSGYASSGSTTLSCTNTGAWSGYGTCPPKNCGTPTNPTNGVFTCSSGTTYPNTCTMSCNAGYQISVSPTTISCLASATWSTYTATCQPKNCGTPTNPTNGLYTCSSGTTYPNSCTMSCNAGYDTSGPTSVSCTTAGTWGTYGTCVPKNCGTPTNPTNGLYTCSSGTTYSQTCSMSCNAGYVPSGTSSITCTTAGTWSTYGTCPPRDCGAPTNPTNGVYTCSSGTTYPNTCTMSCNSGYASSGSTTLSCTNTGAWSGYGTCPPKNCGTPTNPTNGVYTCSSGTTYPNTCTMSCNAGYDTSGSTTLSCLNTGSWSTYGTCAPKNCGTPVLTSGTFSCTSGTTYPNTCTATCNNGYTLGGASSINCLNTGSWSTLPTCSANINYCDNTYTSSPTNGITSCTNSGAIGSVCTYTCNAGYLVTSTSSTSTTRSCSDNGVSSGTWGSAKPTCSINNNYCSTLTAPTFGNAPVCTNQYSILTSCTFSCQTGYQTSHSTSLTCSGTGASGNWNTAAPTCNIIANYCPVPPSAPSNGGYTATCSNRQYQATCSYTCNPGYYMSGVATATCQANNQWSAVPTCIPCSPITNCSSSLTCTTASDSQCTGCVTGNYLVHSTVDSCPTCPQISMCATQVTCTAVGNSVCTSCAAGYYRNAGSPDTCVLCPSVPNCVGSVTCTSASDSRCSACASGRYKVTGAAGAPDTCPTCNPITNCTSSYTCTTASDSQCTTCVTGNYLVEGTVDSCPVCPQIGMCATQVTCSAVGNSVCTTCADGYYRTTGTPNTCTMCTPVTGCGGSVTCTSASDSRCSACLPGRYRVAGTAGNPDTCPTCAPVTNCTSSLTCTSGSNSQCTSCVTGNYLVHSTVDTCPVCPQIAMCTTQVTCTAVGNSVCTGCAAGYYRATGSPDSCTICPSVAGCVGSVTCTSASDSRCSACASGKYKTTGAAGAPDTCTNCAPVANCTSALTCTTASDSQCTTCVVGSYLQNGAASSCPTCPQIGMCTTQVTCTSAANSVCTTCATGYYRAPGSPDSCIICPAVDGCVGSVTCTSALDSRCSACASGKYKLAGSVGTPDTCPSCTPIGNCTSSITCSSATTSQCTSCATGSYLLEGVADACPTCSPVTGCISNLTCITSSSSQCTTCEPGRFRLPGTPDFCVLCSYVPNCVSNLTCTSSFESVCTACSSEYYLGPLGMSCVSCTPAVCPPGKYESTPCTSNGNRECSSCTGVSNCSGNITCTTAGNSQCSACADGYYLVRGTASSPDTCVPCSSPCPSGKYAQVTCGGTSDYVCATCTHVTGCVGNETCTDAFTTRCSACDVGLYRFNNTIVDQCLPCTNCESGTYASVACSTLSNRVCTSCTPVAGCTSALTCTTASNSQCTSCAFEKYLSDGVEDRCLSCSNNCTAGYYESVHCSTSSNRACTACTPIPTCQTFVSCTNAGDSVCAQCGLNQYYNNSACHNCLVCNSATQYVASACSVVQNAVCGTCDSQCLGGCTGAGPASCNACKNYLYENTCVATCPANTFLNVTSKTCFPCKTCGVGYYRLSSCTATSDAVCSECPALPNCDTPACAGTSSVTCAKCKLGYRLSSPTTCTACSGACSTGFYISTPCSQTANQERVCSSCTPIANCSPGSLTCTNSTNSQCSNCNFGYYRTLGAPDTCTPCAGTCAAGTFESTSCLPTETTNRVCTSCTPIVGCVGTTTCISSTSSRCSACSNGTVISNIGSSDICAICATTPCPAGGYEFSPCTSTHDRVCRSCNSIPNCDSTTCNGPTLRRCATCSAGYYLVPFNGTEGADTCVACNVCKPGQFASPVCGGADGQTNSACHNCKTVSNCNGPTSCTSPSTTFCPNCNDGYYRSISNITSLVGEKCVPCTPPVNCTSGRYTCTSSSSSICISNTFDEESDKGFLSQAAVAGPVIAILILLAIAICLLVFFVYRKRRHSADRLSAIPSQSKKNKGDPTYTPSYTPPNQVLGSFANPLSLYDAGSSSSGSSSKAFEAQHDANETLDMLNSIQTPENGFQDDIPDEEAPPGFKSASVRGFKWDRTKSIYL